MTIEKQIDELTKEQFVFSIFTDKIVLSTYNLLLRENKTKRKYRSIKCYDRVYTRNSNIPLGQVTLTDDIRNEAKLAFIKRLEVLTWEEYKNK